MCWRAVRSPWPLTASLSSAVSPPRFPPPLLPRPVDRCRVAAAGGDLDTAWGVPPHAASCLSAARANIHYGTHGPSTSSTHLLMQVLTKTDWSCCSHGVHASLAQRASRQQAAVTFMAMRSWATPSHRIAPNLPTSPVVSRTIRGTWANRRFRSPTLRLVCADTRHASIWH